MKTAVSEVTVRPMVFSDLKAIVAIDREMRASGTPVAYRELSAHRVLGIGADETNPSKRPDILKLAELVDIAFVAESEGAVCGFIVGRQLYIAERDIHEGHIAMIAISPHHWGKGIATKLIDALCKSFLAKGIHRMGVAVDPDDKAMLALLERSGFSSDRLLRFHKKI